MRKVFISVLFLIFGLVSTSAQTTQNSDTVMILPFENTSGKPEFNWVGESFADSLSDLLKVPALNVVSNDERKLIQTRLQVPLTTLPRLAPSDFGQIQYYSGAGRRRRGGQRDGENHSRQRRQIFERGVAGRSENYARHQSERRAGKSANRSRSACLPDFIPARQGSAVFAKSFYRSRQQNSGARLRGLYQRLADCRIRFVIA